MTSSVLDASVRTRLIDVGMLWGPRAQCVVLSTLLSMMFESAPYRGPGCSNSLAEKVPCMDAEDLIAYVIFAVIAPAGISEVFENADTTARQSPPTLHENNIHPHQCKTSVVVD